MGINVTSDLSGVYKAIERKEKRMKEALGQQILKDSNYFAPQDTGALISSSIVASDFQKLLLVWDSPYARRLYWNPQFNFSKDKNPNARGLWFEAAKSMYLSEWVRMAERVANG